VGGYSTSHQTVGTKDSVKEHGGRPTRKLLASTLALFTFLPAINDLAS